MKRRLSPASNLAQLVRAAEIIDVPYQTIHGFVRKGLIKALRLDGKVYVDLEAARKCVALRARARELLAESAAALIPERLSGASLVETAPHPEDGNAPTPAPRIR